jgi:glutamate/tyrosine decarboxylase-like PLP-dependent enzyme
MRFDRDKLTLPFGHSTTNVEDEEAWLALAQILTRSRQDLRQRPVTPAAGGTPLRETLARDYAFQAPRAAEDLVREVGDLLRDGLVDVTHPAYFGLFNPSVRPITVLADALTALFNPQLAVWSHAPAANEIERHTLAFFLGRLGLDPELGGGCFTTGGAEANLTAATLALAASCSAWRTEGIRGFAGHPRIYVSEEAHHSFDKIVAQTGLGANALSKIPVDGDLRMLPGALQEAIARDRAAAHLPLMVVGTAGTTGAGAIDPLPELAGIARDQGLWFHVDAAWGGFACLCPGQAGCLAGISQADSVTWDAHKGLSVPMGAGMFFCRDRSHLEHAFGIATGYMPSATTGVMDPYTSTIQWSRRFIGLKVFMALAELGEAGYGSLIGHQFQLGRTLRARLLEAGWTMVNDTPLPVLCFTHPAWVEGDGAIDRVVATIQARGRAWLSKVRLAHHGWVLRACITSYHSAEEDLDTLLRELAQAL